ncbi:uncharacterized protein (DUF697 family) [Hymenobacter sp. UYAg731]
MYNNEFSQEFEQAIGQELETGGSSMETFEFNPEFMGETSGETQGESFEMSGEMNETLEMEFAHELLEVSNEQELNQFLGSFLKKAAGAVGNFAKSSVGRTIGGVLKSVAKKVIPIAGGALGTFVGGPLGGMVGSKLGSMASNLFELELEGLSPEDQEFETARAFVRFANAAVNRAATLQNQRRGMPTSAVVRQALANAATQHAPGLLRPRNADGTFRSMNGRNGQYANRNGHNGARRPGYPAPGQPARYGAPAYGYAAAPATNGYDQGGYDDNGDQGDYAPASTGRATRGTWMRRGRTLVINL